MYRKLSYFLIGILLISLYPTQSAFADQPIKLIINNKEIICDVVPQIINGRTMCPARYVAEALGATVSWDESNNAVVINNSSSVDPPQIQPDNNIVKLIVNGKEITCDVAPQIINDRTMCPARYVAEALGTNVSWDQGYNAVIINNSSSALAVDGALSVSSSPKGADVYIDGEQYKAKTSPCEISLTSGTHTVELVIPGYETYCTEVKISEGQTTVIKDIVQLPKLPEDARVITITKGDDPDPGFEEKPGKYYTWKTLGTSVSLRQAIAAVMNDKDTKQAYIIEFAVGVDKVIANDCIQIEARGNLAINGDKNRDGTADVTISSVDNSENCAINVRASDVRLCGCSFAGNNMEESAFSSRVDNYSTEYFEVDNMYVLGCSFIDCGLIPLGGACKVYGTGAAGYGEKGVVNYKNVVCSGNTLLRSYFFTAYSGDSDYCVTDGMVFAANTIIDGNLNVNGGDTNTRFGWGDTKEGNGGIPGQSESSDHNIMRNVVISGNTITTENNKSIFAADRTILFGGGIIGCSYNAIENVTVRNNVLDNGMEFKAASPQDFRNGGRKLVTSGNSICQVLIEYNKFIFRNDNAKNYLRSVWPDPKTDASTVYIANNNKLENIAFNNNTVFAGYADDELRDTLCQARVVSDEDQLSAADEAIGNTITGLTASDNVVYENYKF